MTKDINWEAVANDYAMNMDRAGTAILQIAAEIRECMCDSKADTYLYLLNCIAGDLIGEANRDNEAFFAIEEEEEEEGESDNE